MIDIEHGKLTTITSYFDGEVASERHQAEVSIFSGDDTLLKDVIEALSLIKRRETTKLELCIQLDKQDRIRIIKKWQV